MGKSRADASFMLTVSHGNVDYWAAPGEEVTFGRSGARTIQLDGRREDRLLHRFTGAFRFDGGHWELHNEGDALPLHVEIVGGLKATVEPGSFPFLLPWDARGTVSVSTTRAYNMAFSTAQGPPLGSAPGYATTATDAAIATEGLRDSLSLTAGEDRMLVALCEPRLLDPSKPAWVIPEYPELCYRLGGISKRRAEDLIDGLARKFSPFVPDLVGDVSGRQQYRRHMIVDFALRTRSVTRSDLSVLNKPEPPKA